MATELTVTDIAWFAGLFEGEGCISIDRNGTVGLTVRMTDRDIVERVDRLFPSNGITIVYPKPARPHYNQPKPQHCWRIRGNEVGRILELILPYLGERRTEKALLTLSHLATRPGTGGTHRARTHCPHGHEYSAENTYVNPSSGFRACRQCQSRWDAQHREQINARRRKPGGRGPYKKRTSQS